MKKLTMYILAFSIMIIFSSEINFAQQNDCKQLPKFSPGKAKVENKGNLIIIRRESDYGNSITISIADKLIEKNSVSECEILEIELSASFEGDKIAPTDDIDLTLESIANNYLFDSASDRKFTFQVDGKQLFTVDLEQKWRDEITNKVKREYLRTDKNVTFDELRQLAESKKVTIQIGKKILLLTPQQHQKFKDFYNELNKPELTDRTTG